MAHPIERKIILVDGRHVHLRLCGDGPPLLMLHQSPRTSEELEPLMQQWAQDFTCIAPDHPGFGLSDPLPIEAPHVEDFGDATAALIDALGVPSLPVYGFHTGAKIGLAMAVKHPGKISSIVLNGLLVNTQADRDDLAENYLPAFVPSQDARHLFQVWWRMREQTLFFPWYNRKPEARMAFGIRPPQDTHAATMDFLSAEDNYRKGYGAALAMVSKDYVEKLTVNALVTAAKPDPLWEDIGRLTSAGQTTVERFESPEPLLATAVEKLREGKDSKNFDRSVLEQAGHRRIAGGLTCFCSKPADDPTVLAVPDLGSEWLCERAVFEAADASVLAVNPTGHGLSQSEGAFPKAPVDTVAAFGFGVAHLPDVLASQPQSKIVLVDLLLPTQDEAAFLDNAIPDLTPQASGAHLAEACLAIRSALVFWPRDDTSPQNAVPGEHLFDAYDLHIKTRALLRSWQAAKGATQKVLPALDSVLQSGADVTIALPDWAEGRADVRKAYANTKIVYYPFKDRTKALARLIS